MLKRHWADYTAVHEEIFVLRGVTDRTVHLKGNSCIRKATESGENRQLLWPPAVREVHNAS